MSLRASVTSSLYFDDVRLPESAALPGVRGLKGPLSCLSEARFGILWGVVGAARACLEAAVEYAKTRVQFGKPIGAFQLTQEKLAWMYVGLGPGRAHRAAPRAAQGRREARSPARSASASWPTYGRRSTSRARPGRYSGATGSRWSIL